MDRLTKIGKILGIIFLYYVIGGQILSGVIWAEGGGIIYLEGINQHWLGSMLFLTLAYSLNIYLLYLISMKVKRKEWKTLTTKTITYRFENNYSNSKKFAKVHFKFIYLLKNKIYTKKYTMIQKRDQLPRVKQFLDKQLQDDKAEAIIYYNPQKESQSAVNYGLSKLDLVIAPELIAILITLLGSSVYIVRSKVNLSNELVTSLLLLLVFIECFLLCAYILSLFIGKRIAGVHDYIGHPLFYNPLTKVKFDLIKDLRMIDHICLQCGEMISKNDQYCSVCGANTFIEDNFDSYVKFSYF